MSEGLSYRDAGVDIDVADAAKREMGKSVDSGDPRVLNRLGAFASLVDGKFGDYCDPVLVLKTEEPGSKQSLAFKYGYVESICYDLIGHLINDIIVMGARPVYVQDCIICSQIEKDIVTRMVRAMSEACREQGCVLVGGETSEQPGVVAEGVYVLSASIVGVVEKDRIVDGSRIEPGDVVLAVASNGLHTNGYTLVRALIDRDPSIVDSMVDGQRFLDVIMTPHRCFSRAFEGLADIAGVHGMAHITGGGVRDNVRRVLPGHVDAEIDLGAIRVLPIFSAIQRAGNVDEADMLRTFNMGVGMAIVCHAGAAGNVVGHLSGHDCDCYRIGRIGRGSGQVNFGGSLVW